VLIEARFPAPNAVLYVRAEGKAKLILQFKIKCFKTLGYHGSCWNEEVVDVGVCGSSSWYRQRGKSMTTHNFQDGGVNVRQLGTVLQRRQTTRRNDRVQLLLHSSLQDTRSVAQVIFA